MLRQRVVTAGGIKPTAELSKGDRAFGQALENQVVELSVSDKVDGRVDPVTGETCAAAQSDGIAHVCPPVHQKLSAPVASATTVITSVVAKAHPKM